MFNECYYYLLVIATYIDQGLVYKALLELAKFYLN